MRIQHNIMAMNAYRNYNTNTSALSKNLEKLSSGYKINRAGDDAAGLAISEKMRAQITGLNAAQKNVKDGISLVKTAEGAMQEIQDMLNRMDYLATQSANGTYDNEVDRANLQKEVESLKSEINRIAKSANFNGIKLLNGDQAETTSTTGASAAVPAAFTPTIDEDLNVDGQRPSEAVKASFKVKIDTGATNQDTEANFKGITIGGSTLDKLFDIDGTFANGAELTLTAKTAGELSAAAMTDINAIAGVSEVTNGKNEGAGTDATKTEYTFEFDFSKVAGGQTFTVGTKTFEISTGKAVAAGNAAIDLKDLDLTDADDQLTAANAIVTAINGTDLTAAADTTGKFKDLDTAVAADINGGKFKATMTAWKAGEDTTNLGNVRLSESARDEAAITTTYTASLKEGQGKVGTFAEVTYKDFDISKLKKGDSLTIGGYTVNVVDATSVQENPVDKTVEIKVADATDADKLVAAFERAGLQHGKLDFGSGDDAGKIIHITDATDVGGTAEDLADAMGVTYTDANAKAAVAGTTTKSGGLTLQIGDTADEFNQLSVKIGSMMTTAMGFNLDSKGNITTEGTSIDAVDISSIKGAQDAIQTIKNAINYVSSVRGDLGATQNRLEHTANNLSVMAENIQDAESTIRDTDVAEEMMAYTKNNILIQSAQAMLAQANAVPQGVLQLLG